MAPTTPTILVLGTCDTKLSELLYTKSQIEKYVPCTVQIMDIGRSATSHELITFTQDIYTSHFTSLKRPTVEIESLDRSKYIDTLAPYACSFVADLFAENKLHAILGIGGSCGTALATQVMRDALPVGFPKLMVSTMASGDVGPYVGQTDVTMMYSVVDIAGRNRLLERVLGNAAGAIVGMAKVYFDDLVSKSTPTRPDDQPHAVSDEKIHSTDSNQSQPESQSQSDPVRIGITMFGVTTPAATTARHRLEAILPNCEIYIFHATGSGGKAMERLISEHQLDAVLDLTTTEIADHVVGGVLSAGPSRLCAATKRNIPRVLSLGACDMINFGPPESIPSAFATGSNLNLDSAPGSSSSPGSASASASASGPPPGAQQERVFHRHNPTVTLMRTTSDECVQIAKCIATNLLEGNAGWDEDCRTKVILPLGGLSLLDTPDQPFWDPKADHALFSTLEDELRGSEIAVVRDERPINDPGFATAAADLLGDLIHQSRRARESEE